MTGAVERKKHYRRVANKPVAAQPVTAAAPATAPAVEATPAPAAVTSKDDPRWQWCEQRHLDHQAGRAPGGAQDLEQKLKDDRTCAAVYAERAGRPASDPEALQAIDTGAISPGPAAAP